MSSFQGLHPTVDWSSGGVVNRIHSSIAKIRRRLGLLNKRYLRLQLLPKENPQMATSESKTH
jgi:hypothetical protein